MNSRNLRGQAELLRTLARRLREAPTDDWKDAAESLDLVATDHEATADYVDSRPETTLIQWRGEDPHLDFWCPCGTYGWLPTGFAYCVKCPTCGSLFGLGSLVHNWRIADAETPKGEPVTLEVKSRWNRTAERGR